MIVAGGIQMMISGDLNQTEEGTKRVVNGLTGIGILLLSGLILNIINPNFYIF